MGLDMYLTEEKYIGAKYEHRNVTGKVDIKIGKEKIDVPLNKISIIILDIGYWRKANQIHNWFVKNVQDGIDECQKSYVSYEQLMELKNVCEEVLKTKDASKLPPADGFFFGSTDINEYYFDDLRHTIEILTGLDPEGEYFYQASW